MEQSSADRPAPSATPRWVDRHDLAADPALQEAVRSLVARFGRELSVAVARASIAPHVFVGTGERSVFFVNRRASSILAFAYAGPDECFVEAARELYAYAEPHKAIVNILDEEDRARDLAAAGYSATPFGVMQKLPDIARFTLEGGPMRRLRYQIGHYEKGGPCVTREYRCGTDPSTDGAIAALVDAWAAGKKQVGPYVEHFRRDIAAGRLPPGCRMFLTYRGERVDSAIVLSRLAAADGYLMDLEFYGEEMPLGGLEFAIVEVQRTLAREGARFLSLGSTFGTQLDPCPDEDARVGKMLRGWHSGRLFNNDGNFQFKSKFRPQCTRLYICRTRAAPAATFAEVFAIFADPENRRQSRPAAPAAARPPTSAAVGPAPGDAAAYRAVYDAKDGILANHLVAGRPILPAASMVDLAFAAAGAAGRRGVALKNVVICRPGIAHDQLVVDVRCRGSAFTVHAGRDLLCTGRIEEGEAPPGERVRAVHAEATDQSLDVRELYADLERSGYRYGPLLRVIRSAVRTTQGMRVELAVTEASAGHSAIVNPALVDGSIHALFCLLRRRGAPAEATTLPVPVGIDRVTVHQKPPPRCWAFFEEAALRRRDGDVVGDIVLIDERGERLLTIQGLLLKYVAYDFLDKYGTPATSESNR